MGHGDLLRPSQGQAVPPVTSPCRRPAICGLVPAWHLKTCSGSGDCRCQEHSVARGYFVASPCNDKFLKFLVIPLLGRFCSTDTRSGTQITLCFKLGAEGSRRAHGGSRSLIHHLQELPATKDGLLGTLSGGGHLTVAISNSRSTLHKGRG